MLLPAVRFLSTFAQTHNHVNVQPPAVSGRDKCMLALEQKVERLDSVLRRLEQGVASKASVVGLQARYTVVASLPRSGPSTQLDLRGRAGAFC